MEYKVCCYIHNEWQFFHARIQTHMPALAHLQMELEEAYKKTLAAKK